MRYLSANAADADLLLVVNGIATSQLRARIERAAPRARVVDERRSGLDMARNQAIAAATTDLLAFVDDYAEVSIRWLGSVRRTFALNPGIDALTGLVLPARLETPGQASFKAYGGFGRGCRSTWWQSELAQASSGIGYLATWRVGSATNMVFRRDALARLGGFYPSLDVGTATGGAGDLEIYYRFLRAGAELLYEPRALVVHRHRQDFDEVRRQVAEFGFLLSMLLEIVRVDRDELPRVLRLVPTIISYFPWRASEGLKRRERRWWQLLGAEISGYAAANTGRPLRRALALTAATSTTAPVAGWPRLPVPVPSIEKGESHLQVEVNAGVSERRLSRNGFVNVEILRSGRLIGRAGLFTPVALVSAQHLRSVVAAMAGAELADPGSPVLM